jgi:small subunit ribosomal protein S17
MKPVVGIVVSNKMQKSVVVAVDRLFHNKVYNRYVKRTSKFMAHDDDNTCNIGDRVCNSCSFDSSPPLPRSDFVRLWKLAMLTSVRLVSIRYWILLLTGSYCASGVFRM